MLPQARRISLVLVLLFALVLMSDGALLAVSGDGEQSPPTLQLPADALSPRLAPAESTGSGLMLYTHLGTMELTPPASGVTMQTYFYADTVREYSYTATGEFSGSRYTISLVLGSASSTTFAAELLVNDQVLATAEAISTSTTYSRFETVVDGTPIDGVAGDTIVLRVMHVSGGNGGLLSTAPPNGTFVEIADTVAAIPEINISSDVGSVGEGDGSVTFDVVLDQASDMPITVDLDVSGDGATAGQDFTLANSSLTFASGETNKSFAATIVDDLLDEDDESFTVTITDPTNAELGHDSSATVRIVDNDAPPALSFASSTAALREDRGSVLLTIASTAPSERAMSVVCNVTGGDATPGADFIMERQVVEFAPGQTERQVTFRVLNDDIAEETETALLALSDPTNSQLGSSSSVTVEIADDDSPTSKELFVPMVVDGASSTPPTSPSAPVLNAINNPTGSQTYAVSWNGVAGATSYTLQEADNASFISPSVAYSGSGLTHSVTGHAPGTLYYRVNAKNSAGTSPWSSPQSVVVNAAPACPTAPGAWSGSSSSSFTVTDDCKVRDFTITVPFLSSTCHISAIQDIPIGDVGHYSSLAIDQEGNSSISYYDQSNEDLKYAHWDGSGWSAVTVDSEGSVGQHTSLALDAAGNPRISYYDSTNGTLKYASWTGSNWQLQTVDAAETVGTYNSLALDSVGNPHISYYDLTNRDLKYAHWTGASWQFQTVDAEDTVGYDTSLDLDAAGNPHISYYDLTNKDLKYAHWNGSDWDIQTVDSAGTVGYDTSLALDVAGHAHIGYYDSSNSDLKYAFWNGSAWQIQTVDSSGKVGYDPSLALDSAGAPRISYYDLENRDLKYALWTGSQWVISVVESNGDVGGYSSLALDSDDAPRISYHDAIEGDLRHAGQQGAVWEQEIVDSLIADAFILSDFNKITGAFTNTEELAGAYLVYLCGSTITIPASAGEWTANRSSVFSSEIASTPKDSQKPYEHRLVDETELESYRQMPRELRTTTSTLLPGTD